MKTTSISSLAISQSMQSTVSTAMTEITKLQDEAVTGTYSDVGLELGTRTSTSLDYSRESSRLQSVIDANSFAETRMEGSQLALTNISDAGQTLLDALTALSGNSDVNSLKVSADSAMSVLENFVSYANTAVNGEYLFSGISTDVQTFDDDFIANVTDDFNTAFTNFRTANGIASAGDVTAGQMTQFLSDYETSFNWASWTNASDTVMTTRISSSETVATSTSANSEGFKNLVLASVVASQLSNAGLGSGALSVVSQKATQYAGTAISGVTAQQSALGLSQERIDKANTYMSNQIKIIDTQLTGLVGVDTEEASVRLSTLLNQVETSYSITSRILGMSLADYL
ncbi:MULTISPECIES: flagellar hook-associated family protein [Rhizobiaceae]|jgi:flagellar hook-associated protein 3 FlgL|uniref:Flagellin n=1 Tax=Aliirhizobium cellulosilyticum TaxID=393664 RepID=A0A7W6TE77_9HYPH|nr:MULTISPECIES: flagellar hook-associated family protein [Rhizobium/Agrobacterium group]MBB4348650.1 flagellar hook-associated protein 3 FlgL [Rhizobium cellulosilyticum]MBB4411886.1 flagellar hook-associated protein 3 FlgL [Rhizobium cellulosilyticum]MBB4446577.1 flagellar hook-associated protein 3 FlgL [Rhizobium cellulosilyticum]MBO0140301.1 flagellar hook-associated family protein [Agrobacterium sp. Ap1]